MGTEFDLILRRLKIDHLIICGTQLPNCVRCTVYDAYIIALINLGIHCINVNKFIHTFHNLEYK